MTASKRLATAAKPNGSTYAAPFHRIYVADTLRKAVAVVDVNKDEIVKTLSFNSETGMPQYDSVAKKIYVNLRNSNEVAEIDPATRRNWSGSLSPFGVRDRKQPPSSLSSDKIAGLQ